MEESEVVQPLLKLRQHQQGGVRSPHKPLLALLALAQLDATGSSALPWSEVEGRLAALIADFGPPSRTGTRQSAAYPFTRLRSDGVWVLDHDVPMDLVGPLDRNDVVGRFTPAVERELRADHATLVQTARALVDAEFPSSIAPDVLLSVGLDPEVIYDLPPLTGQVQRRRSGSWPSQILLAWDRCCAFCGYDGQLGSAAVGLEAAHVRWFNFDGPDDLDNGLALCSLHHKLFDRGVLGLSDDLTIQVSPAYTARTESGRQVYDLAERKLRPRVGTEPPAAIHVQWHQSQVFKAAIAS